MISNDHRIKPLYTAALEAVAFLKAPLFDDNKNLLQSDEEIKAAQGRIQAFIDHTTTAAKNGADYDTTGIGCKKAAKSLLFMPQSVYALRKES